MDPADKSQVPFSPSPLIPSCRYGREEEGWSQWRKVRWSQDSNPRIHKVKLSSSAHFSSNCFDFAECNLQSAVVQLFFNTFTVTVQCEL